MAGYKVRDTCKYNENGLFLGTVSYGKMLVTSLPSEVFEKSDEEIDYSQKLKTLPVLILKTEGA